MKQKPYPVDPICMQVAEHFLSDVFATERERRELAEDIQRLCEDFCVVLTRKKAT